MLIQIKNKTNNSIIFQHDEDNNTLKKTLELAVSQNVNLTNADLKFSDLQGATLSGGNFTSADFLYSNMKNCSLTNCNFSNVIFKFVNLNGADMSNSNRTNSEFEKCDTTNLIL